MRRLRFAVALLFLFLACAPFCLTQQPKTIHILLLNGNDGKPLTIGNTGQEGAPLSLTVFPNCGRACLFPGQRFTWAVDAAGRTEVPIIDKLQSLQLMKPSSWFNYCQGTPTSNGALDKDPEFAVDAILRQGMIAPNQCNEHLHLRAQPGELIFFLRPLSWWERLTKPPQM